MWASVYQPNKVILDDLDVLPEVNGSHHDNELSCPGSFFPHFCQVIIPDGCEVPALFVSALLCFQEVEESIILKKNMSIDSGKVNQTLSHI